MIKTILVTGHLGYIGAVLVPKLLNAGYLVKGIDAAFYEDAHHTEKLEPINEQRKDIRDCTLADFSKVDAVIHLAGLSNDPLGDYCPELTDDINFQASKHIATLAKKAGVKRFIFASSCSIYGASDDTFLDEDAAQKPVTPYAVSKGETEQALNALADDQFTPSYLRASTVYGHSPRIRYDLVVNNLTAWAQATGKVQLKSDGQAWRPMVHADDIADAYLTILSAPKEAIYCRAFNVGETAQNYLVSEIAQMVCNGISGSKLSLAQTPNHDARCYRVNCDRIYKELNYTTNWNIPDAVKQMQAALIACPVSVEAFEGAQYSRIAHILDKIKQGKLDKNLRWLE